MNEIKCPHCGTVFQIQETDYLAIVKQVRDKEFDKEIKQRQLNIDYKDTKQLLEKERETATNFISNIIGN